MADLDQAGRQDVEEKPADKLDGVQRHELGLVVMGRVSPAKRDPAILHRDEAPVGDSNAVGVACQILEHLLRATKWALGIDEMRRSIPEDATLSVINAFIACN
jgi:hypothetical protein